MKKSKWIRKEVDAATICEWAEIAPDEHEKFINALCECDYITPNEDRTLFVVEPPLFFDGAL